MSDIFISYRRNDTAGDTRSIRDRLSTAFSRRQVFMDVDTIPVGVDFREYLATSIRRCQVVLVVIGPQWLDAKNAEGKRRLDDPQDYVRVEIEIALARNAKKEIRIIPVLLNGAPMPPAAALPASLRPIAFRNAIDIRHGSFDRDVAELVKSLEQYVQAPPRPAPATEPEPSGGGLPPRMILGLAVATVALLVLAASLAAAYFNRAGRFDPQQAAQRVTLRLDEGDLQGADKLANEILDLNPGLADAASFQEVLKRIAAEKAEVKRQYDCRELLGKLQSARPETISADDLQRLDQLSRTRAEKDEVARLHQQRTSALAMATQAHNEQAARVLHQISTNIEELRVEPTATRANVNASLASAAETLTPMIDDPRLEASTTRKANDVLQEVRRLLDSSATRIGDTDYGATITDNVGQPTAYQKSLAAFARGYAATAAAADIRSLSGEVSLWESVQAWSEVLDRDEFADLSRLAPAQSNQLNDLLTEVEAKYGPYPLLTKYEALRAYLQSINSRVDRSGNAISQQLKSYLARDPRILGLWMIEMKDGRRYYGTGKPPRPGNGASLRVSVLKNYRNDQQQVTLASNEIAAIGEAPQSKLGRTIAQRLPDSETAELLSAKWEPVFCDLLAAVRSQPGLEPILAADLYYRILSVATQGSYPMQLAFESDLRALRLASIDTTVNWFDPDDTARTARISAQQVLASLRPVADRQQQVLELSKKSFRVPVLRWFGWLCRDAGGWQACAKQLPAEGTIYVVVRDSDRADAIVGFHAIGRIEAGKAVWEGAEGLFVEGRPLYVGPKKNLD